MEILVIETPTTNKLLNTYILFMTFPFVIELEKKINTKGDIESQLKIYDLIQSYLKSKSVDNCYRTGNIIKFKQSFFVLNSNVFATIDSGEMELIDNSGAYSLKYRFYLVWFFIISCVITVGFGLISGKLIVSIVVFMVLVLGNFVICLVRQQGVINDLVYIIDEANRNKNTTTGNGY
jgi:hypothetical protein